MAISVKEIDPSTSEFEIIKAIRQTVFVIEQEVDPAEEFDEFELISTHFLAMDNDIPAGTCRFRKTDKGVKLERFAILEAHRRRGLGSALVQSCLSKLDLSAKIYLHAQVDAMPLYLANGFKPYGDLFYECNIPHYAMKWHSESL